MRRWVTGLGYGDVGRGFSEYLELDRGEHSADGYDNRRHRRLGYAGQVAGLADVGQPQVHCAGHQKQRGQDYGNDGYSRQHLSPIAELLRTAVGTLLAAIIGRPAARRKPRLSSIFYCMRITGCQLLGLSGVGIFGFGG